MVALSGANGTIPLNGKHNGLNGKTNGIHKNGNALKVFILYNRGYNNYSKRKAVFLVINLQPVILKCIFAIFRNCQKKCLHCKSFLWQIFERNLNEIMWISIKQ